MPYPVLKRLNVYPFMYLDSIPIAVFTFFSRSLSLSLFFSFFSSSSHPVEGSGFKQRFEVLSS